MIERKFSSLTSQGYVFIFGQVSWEKGKGRLIIFLHKQQVWQVKVEDEVGST